jgi:integrase
VIRHLGDQRLESVIPEDLTRLYADLANYGRRGDRPLARKTVRHVHTTVRRALADAVRRRHLAWNLAASVKDPRVDRPPEPRSWTPEELRTFLAAVGGDRLEAVWTSPPQLGCGAQSSSGCGGPTWSSRTPLRSRSAGIGRLLRGPLAQGTEDLGEPTHDPAEPAGGRGTGRQHSRQAKDRLAAGEAYEDRGLVFAGELGDPLEPETVSKTFTRLVARSGLRPLSLHGLRHTFATLGLEAGVDVLEVAAVLGHSSPAITQAVYQHTRPERKRAAVDTIGAVIFG